MMYARVPDMGCCIALYSFLRDCRFHHHCQEEEGPMCRVVLYVL